MLTASMLSTACVHDVNADYEVKQVSLLGDNGNKIRIINGFDKSQAQYRVNGKTFTWQDLTKRQQSQILVAEKPLKEVEALLDLKEEELNLAVEEVEAKSEEIEEIAELIEDAIHDVDYEDMSIAEVKEQKAKLKKVLKKHDLAMKVKQLELEKLEDKLPKIDKQLLKDVKHKAQIYEQTLVEVAAEL